MSYLFVSNTHNFIHTVRSVTLELSLSLTHTHTNLFYLHNIGGTFEFTRWGTILVIFLSLLSLSLFPFFLSHFPFFLCISLFPFFLSLSFLSLISSPFFFILSSSISFSTCLSHTHSPKGILYNPPTNIQIHFKFPSNCKGHFELLCYYSYCGFISTRVSFCCRNTISFKVV